MTVRCLCLFSLSTLPAGACRCDVLSFIDVIGMSYYVSTCYGSMAPIHALRESLAGYQLRTLCPFTGESVRISLRYTSPVALSRIKKPLFLPRCLHRGKREVFSAGVARIPCFNTIETTGILFL